MVDDLLPNSPVSFWILHMVRKPFQSFVIIYFFIILFQNKVEKKVYNKGEIEFHNPSF